jgi:ABC-type multidrug transport system ATPase subunit
VSHALGEVEQLCDRVGVLVEGQLVFTGRISDLPGKSNAGQSQGLEAVLKRLYPGPRR